MPTVSIVLPTYNRAYCLDRAVGSVLAQTFDDWELILVDDGSTDETPALRREFAQALRCRYSDVASSRLGASGARNLGVSKAKGEWIAFLDSDDVWLPEKLDLQLAALNANPDAGFCYTDFFEFDDAWKILHPRHLIPAEMVDRIYPQLLEIRNNLITCPSVIARRDLLVGCGGFNENMKVCEDIDLWTRLAQLAPAAAVKIPLTGVHSRHNHQFPYADSLLGRHMLYSAAVQRDGALSADFVEGLYGEAFATFIGVAHMKGDSAEAQLIEAAEKPISVLLQTDPVAAKSAIHNLVDALRECRAH